MHHVRALKDLKGKNRVEKLMRLRCAQAQDCSQKKTNSPAL